MNEDDDILGEFLIEAEDDDLTLVMLPKLKFDLEGTLTDYYKLLKKCRTKDQMINVLSRFYAYIYGVAVLETEINYLQDRAKTLEASVMFLGQDR
jgi:hypothetical protein